MAFDTAIGISLHSGENYQPRDVNIMVEQAALMERCAPFLHKQEVPAGDLTVEQLAQLDAPNCPWYTSPWSHFYYMDLPENDNTNPQKYEEKYDELVKTNQYPEVTYARVVDLSLIHI